MRARWPPNSSSPNTSTPRSRPKNFTEAKRSISGSGRRRTSSPAATVALVEAAVIAFPAPIAVPVIGVAVAVMAGESRQTAEHEPLICFAVDVVGLDSGAVTGRCVGDVQGLAETVGDEGIA